MKIQEALTKVRELKADAQSLLQEASSQRVRIIYLEVDKAYYADRPKRFDGTNQKIGEALTKIKEAHFLKLAVQKANVENGMADRIQELDYLKSLCSGIKDFVSLPERTDPQVMATGSLRAQTTYKIEEATFNTSWMDETYRQAQDRIRQLNEELQALNWQVEIDLATLPESWFHFSGEGGD